VFDGIVFEGVFASISLSSRERESNTGSVEE
jgi:hypothetical protein